MELYKFEPWGEKVEDLRAGTVAAVIANVNRNAKAKPTPFVPADFTPWSVDERAEAAKNEPILLADKRAQSRLLVATLFGKPH